MKATQNALRTITESRRAYVVLNLVYYGLIICGMVYVAFNRSLQQLLLEAVGSALTEGSLSPVLSAYSSGQVLPAIALTFGVNLTVGSFASITLPSLVIPFSGLLIGAYRAVLWGVMFSPTTLEVSGRTMISGLLVLVLILLEGQAYVLTMLAAYVHGRAFLWPHSVGAATRRRGYWLGVKRSARLYWLVALVLAVAAVYEALVAIYIIPSLLGM